MSIRRLCITPSLPARNSHRAIFIAMAKEFSKAFYNSEAWQRCRKDYIDSVHGLCERCGETGLILHHKIPLTPENIDNPEITLDFKNLEYVCLECHNQIHGGSCDNAVQPGFRFTPTGDYVPKR